MRVVILVAALVAAFGLKGAESVSNTIRWLAPSNGLAAARWPWKWQSPFAIATNTPAFDAWAMEFMLNQANAMREKWRLDIPRPLTVDDVWFAVSPTVHGIEGHLMTRDQRFKWSFDRNVLCAFEDRKFFAPSFRYRDDESARLAKIKSQITKKEAEAIARKALYELFGMTEEQLGLKKTVEVNQYKFTESNGKVYPLPLFEVRWRMTGPRQYSAKNLEYTPLFMEISGIITNVVNYSHPEYINLTSPLPRPVVPTNYFQMLGLPDNYLDTVPEPKRSFLGLPPLTNSGATATNLIR